MEEPIRRLVVMLMLAASAGLAASTPSRADDPPGDRLPEEKPVLPDGQEFPTPFVPEHPRTTEDRERIEAVQRYTAARALEKQQEYAEAIALLEKALEIEPDSVAIYRELSSLNRALGRTEKAIEYSKKVLEADPGDIPTLVQVVAYYDARGDIKELVDLLEGLLKNPALAEDAPGRMLTLRLIGEFEAEKLDEPRKAADAFEALIDLLDSKAAARLSFVDQKLILNDEPNSYLKFGDVFLKAGRPELAIRAFRRGLVYDAEHPLLPRFLAQAQLEADHPEQALETLEAYLKRQPQGSEPYDLLVDILKALKRTDEILPRLEAAAQADSKNIPLQYTLADRYRDEGKAGKAAEIYRRLLENQPDPQGFGALSAALLKDKKYEELIKLLGNAVTVPNGFQAVRPQIETIINDPSTCDALLDEGLELQKAGNLSEPSRKVLAHIGSRAKKLTQVVEMQRLAVEQDPSAQGYLELWNELYNLGRYDEAEPVLDTMLQKYPAERNERLMLVLIQTRVLAGHYAAALETANELLKEDPENLGAQIMVGASLGRLGRNDEAVAHYKKMLEKYAGNDEAVKMILPDLSIIYTNLGAFDKAAEQLETLLERFPDDPRANNDLGYLYADQGKNLDRAEAMIRKALEENPEEPAYLDSLGWVLYKQGKPEEALEPLEKAAESPTVDATILDHLGDVNFTLKRYDAARKAWTRAEARATRTTPPDKILPEIRKKLEALHDLGPEPGSSDAEP